MAEINIEMGEYEILTNPEKTKWLLIDKLGSNEWEFDNLDDVLNKIEREVESVNIE